jgi:SAM-dependent methyltransferase
MNKININNFQDCVNFHNFSEMVNFVLEHPEIADLPCDFLKEYNPYQRRDLIAGEYLYKLSQALGKKSSQLLKQGQWGYNTPDWFDHRHHTMNPQAESKNSWVESVAMTLRILPKNGKILNYCAGEAYFDAEYFVNMASEILCVDINKSNEYKNYLIKNNIERSQGKLKYSYDNILDHEPAKDHYDVVIMRSAIEHFSEEDQIKVISKIKKSLNSTGWFIGDTPANPNAKNEKHHSAHEKEWEDENEARDFLSKHFDEVEVYTIHCNIDPRDTIFWKCR